MTDPVGPNQARQALDELEERLVNLPPLLAAVGEESPGPTSGQGPEVGEPPD